MSQPRQPGRPEHPAAPEGTKTVDALQPAIDDAQKYIASHRDTGA